MGWGPRQDDKSMSLIDRNRAVKLFLDHGRMRASSAAFDQAKLHSFDRKYKALKTNTTKNACPDQSHGTQNSIGS